MAEITLDRISKRFPDGTEAVKETSFTIEDGEFFVLVGPSGCGKSTLLNMIVGLEDVTGGEIRVGGERVNDVDPKDRNMAMVFQSYAIYPHMTVRENMAFPLKMAGMDKAEMSERVEHAAQLLELSEHLERKPGMLSGGQRQRVAMGRAIVRNPRAFLLDEPLSNLDAKLRVQMRTEIVRLHKRIGATTIYVTHDQTEALTLGDRIAVLRGGTVQQIGTPMELYGEPANLFVAGFIGSPAMNFMPARLENGRVALPFGTCDAPESLRGREGERELVAGVRPEHIEAASSEDNNGDAVLTLEAAIEVIEWVGSDLYAYFEVEVPSDRIRALPEDIAVETPNGDRLRMVARLSPATQAREGQDLALCIDPARMQIFDAESGENLSCPSQ